MSLADLDSYYIKSVGYLHQPEPASNVPSHLQMYLEEAIKTKTGVVKDYTSLISTVSNRPLEEIRTTTHVIEESKTTSSSDNELELDLFNEDLMCIVCNGMDVAARNRLLECSDCHSLYHQECHRPSVTSFDPDGNWTCQNCKDASKRMKKSTPGSSPSHAPAPIPTINIKPAMKNSPPHAQQRGSSNLSSSYKSSSSKSVTSTSMSKSSSSSSKSSSKSSSAVANGMKSSATPNIISADKRLQIMKKKAAKLHEKRKQLPR